MRTVERRFSFGGFLTKLEKTNMTFFNVLKLAANKLASKKTNMCHFNSLKSGYI